MTENIVILNAYIFRRYKFHPDNKPRRISGLFTSEFNGTKIPLLKNRKCVRGLKLLYLVFAQMCIIMPPPVGLLLGNPKQDGGELVAEPSSIFDSF